MAAGVHHPRVRGSVRGIGLFLDRQSVHVSAEGKGLPWRRAANQTDHPGPPNPFCHLQAEALQVFGHAGGRAFLPEAKLRVPMEVPANLLEPVPYALYRFSDHSRGLSFTPVAACARRPARAWKLDLYHRRFDEKSAARQRRTSSSTWSGTW
jgi:hypothetical protein